MCDHLNYHWKECLFLVVLIISIVTAHHFVKLTPEEQKTVQLEKDKRQAQAQKACVAAKAAEQKLVAEGVKNASKVVDVKEACEPGASLKTVVGWVVGVFIALTVLFVGGMAFIFNVAASTLR